MKLINHKLVVTLTSFLLSISAFAGEKIDKELSVAAGGKVRISVVRGDVEVKAWSKDAVHVEGELDDATEEFIFETSGADTIIKVEIDDGFFDKKWNSDETDIVIHVPSASSLVAGGVSTEFKISDITGGVVANSVSGDIDVKGSSDKVNVESVSGDIRIEDSWGKMKASSVSGDIETDGKAVYFDAQSVSGDIEATIGKSEIVELSSVSGDIDLIFELMDDGRVDAETVSGDVKIQFDGDDVNARFEINTGPGGDIRNAITKDKPESSFIGAEEVTFKSGNGSGTVEISTMSGTISLEK